MKSSNKSVVLFVVGLVLVAFSIGQMASRPAVAGQYESNDSFNRPRARDLWQFSADGLNTWSDIVQGHVFEVAPDRLGRLPVLTHLHGGAYPGVDWIVKEVDGVFRPFISDRQQGDQGRTPLIERQILPGILLAPGRYGVAHYNGSGNETKNSYRLLLSGYWSRKE